MDTFILVELDAAGGIKSIVRTYCTKQRAEADSALLNAQTERHYEVVTADHIDE